MGLKSMTGYGRASVSSPLGRFVVELQAINRKHLDISFNLPIELTRFEADLRNMIAAAISRGQVSVRLFAYFEKATPLEVTPNLPLIRQLKQAWSKIAQELGLSPDSPISLEWLTQEPGVLIYGENFLEEEKYRHLVHEVVQHALNDMIEMRTREGAALQQDMASRLFKMRSWMQQIADRTSNATLKYQEKLRKRLEDLLGHSVEDEERLLREICLYAERIDISEEITRFYSHLDQYEAKLNSASGAIGKTLEFLTQELQREINTIGSKSADIEISQRVVTIKSELEKLREQLQNIE